MGVNAVSSFRGSWSGSLVGKIIKKFYLLKREEQACHYNMHT